MKLHWLLERAKPGSRTQPQPTRPQWTQRAGTALPSPSERSRVGCERRRHGQKEPPPKGLRRFSVLASLLFGHSPTSGDAPSSRLARTENRRNKRGRIYEREYLVEEQRLGLRLGLRARVRVKQTRGPI